MDQTSTVQAWLVFLTKETPDTMIEKDWENKSLKETLWQQPLAGVFTLSLDGTIFNTNESLQHLTAYTEEELSDMTLWDLSVPEDTATLRQTMQTRLAGGNDPLIFRIRLYRKDRTLFWVRLVLFLQVSPTGEPAYFFAIAEDISKQVETENEHAALLASIRQERAAAEARARQMEAIFTSITDGIMVFDRDSNIIHTNPALRAILHLDSRPDFLTTPFPQRVAVMQAFHDNGQPLKLEDWPTQRLLNGETLTTLDTEDIHQILPNGEEIYVTHTGAPLRDEHNQIVGAVLVIHDVTRRRRLEQYVRKSFNALLALAEALVHIPGRHSEKPSAEQFSNGQFPPALSAQAIGQYLVELTCETLEYQSAMIALLEPETEQLHITAVTGSTPIVQALENKHLTSFALFDYLDQAAIDRLNANEVILWDLSTSSPDGQPDKLLTAPMLLDNRLVGIFSVTKPGPRQEYFPEEMNLVKAVAKLILLVIERERLQMEWMEARSSELALRETNRRFDGFLSIASHELRTPLTGIKGNIQLALRRLGKLKAPPMADAQNLLAQLENIEDYLRRAEHRVNKQNRLINDLLDVSCIQANKLELIINPCDLRKIVSEAVEDQHYNEPGRVITLTFPPCQPLTVNGDADRLGQVIHNYLANALKYSAASQPVAVRIECPEGANCVHVAITDKGPGLTPEEQKHIWERFYRVKGITQQRNADPGLGLGLHINRAIIEAHHGSFGLESTPGQGSTFWFELPLAQTAPLSQCSPSFRMEQLQDTL